jgi:hypothetical protein
MVSIKIMVFWDVRLCSLVVTNISENLGASIFFLQGAGNWSFLTAGTSLPNSTVSHARKPES